MNDKIYTFVGGMPRSGSTLLQAILDQNPEFHAWVSSGLLEIMLGIRNTWDKFIEHQAIAEGVSRIKKRNTLKGVIDSYYKEVPEKHIFDKSRGWVAHIEMAEWVLQGKVKILVPVRDLREILASFELLWRNAAKDSQMAQELGGNYINMQTVAGRCATWMKNDQPVGLAYNRVEDAVRRGYRDRLHFVRYEDLCSRPDYTMDKIYGFLGLPTFQHDFDNIIKEYHESDRVHGIENLHKIRPKISPAIPKANGVLGPDIAEKFAGNYIWNR